MQFSIGFTTVLAALNPKPKGLEGSDDAGDLDSASSLRFARVRLEALDARTVLSGLWGGGGSVL